MAAPARAALTKLAKKRGNIDAYVQSELGYENKEDLYKALSSEQIDAVAMAIAAIEKGKGVVIGDQTGVGKGRVAASIIRYANQKGKKPIFFTAKAKLFSDMYGDLLDIGYPITPFIMHGSPKGGAIVDPDNKIVFKANGTAATYKKMLQDPHAVMEDFDVVFVAYSQVQRENKQRQILAELAPGNIIILDESHTASGDSATGRFIIERMLKEAAGVTYLSATYAKKPQTMPVYMKTSLGDTGLPLESLIDAIAQGGVPLQQVMAKSLAEEGQYIRRELNFSDIAMNTVIDAEHEARDTKRADEITGLLRDIVEFDKLKMDMVGTMDKKAKKEGKRLTGKKYTTAGVTTSNFASTVHNLVGQLLLGIKADNTIETAVKVLKEDKKALINLMNTMGSFIDDYLATQGGKVGDVIDFSFKDVLGKALRGTLKYTVKDAYGGKAVTHRLIPERDFDANTLEIYRGIEGKIANLETKIPASPIDYIKAGIRKAGFSIGEITGRNYIMDYTQNPPVLAKRSAKEIHDRNSTTNDFNSGKLDSLIYNSAGSTGLSVHASEKFKDQRTRHLIIAQADLNIDTFIQALGRIFRKGQVRNPEYTILQTALPAEIRPAVVLAKKMASLNANTSANADSANTMKGVPDMLNIYGDQVVTEYLKANRELNLLLGDPLKLDSDSSSEGAVPEAMRKVSGKVALLPVAIQKTFYADIEGQYRDHIEYLDQIGENNLVSKDYDLQAKTTAKTKIHDGTDESSPFTSSTWLETVSAKVLKKPFTKAKVDEKTKATLNGETPQSFNEKLYAEIKGKADEYVNARKSKMGALSEGEQRVLQLHLGEVKHQVSYIMETLRKFLVGNIYEVAVTDSYETKGILTDIHYDRKGSGSPAAPSKVKLIFAVADPIQTIMLPLSKKLNLRATQRAGERYLSQWDSLIPNSSRESRFIITGNILQGFERFGKK
ncbi:MAG: strawberry notch-like NTP hydrolase domain-containing protein, partial [Thermodesulfobacteriota bacterium]